jgi:hypothetical protein
MKITLGSEDWSLWPRNTRPVQPDTLSFPARRRGLQPIPLPFDDLALELVFEEEREEPETAPAAAEAGSPVDHLFVVSDHLMDAMREVHLALRGLMPEARATVQLEAMHELLDESEGLEESAEHILKICGRLLK